MIYHVKVRVSKNNWVIFASTDELFRAIFIKDALLNEKSPDRYKHGEVKIEEVNE